MAQCAQRLLAAGRRARWLLYGPQAISGDINQCCTCVPPLGSATDLRDAALAAAGAEDKLQSDYVTFNGGTPLNVSLRRAAGALRMTPHGSKPALQLPLSCCSALARQAGGPGRAAAARRQPSRIRSWLADPCKRLLPAARAVPKTSHCVYRQWPELQASPKGPDTDWARGRRVRCAPPVAAAPGAAARLPAKQCVSRAAPPNPSVATPTRSLCKCLWAK